MTDTSKRVLAGMNRGASEPWPAETTLALAREVEALEVEHRKRRQERDVARLYESTFRMRAEKAEDELALSQHWLAEQANAQERLIKSLNALRAQLLGQEYAVSVRAPGEDADHMSVSAWERCSHVDTFGDTLGMRCVGEAGHRGPHRVR